ncbi:MAG: sigma-70 family RNA polymerase sigma factor [Natronohydrobacter sp.]|nr:sigma-70 family RNA polymerase sigma factor [Natronohydrobacter sp.]
MTKILPNWGSRPCPRRFAMLSAEDERRLVLAWQSRGDLRARNRLVQGFLPMATAMAKRSSPGGGEVDPDLFQQAVIGLIKAADRFDPTIGNRFSTYAVWWVRAEIQAYRRANVPVVRRPKPALSRKMALQIARLDASVADKADHERLEAEERFASAMGLSRDRIADLRAQITGRDQSLNTPLIGADGEDRLALLVDSASLEDSGAVHPLDISGLRRALVMAASALSDRERHIILATQLNDPPATLEALGERYGISKERVRQLRERGLSRLRAALRETGMELAHFVSPSVVTLTRS